MEARLSPCGEGQFCFDTKEFISWLVGCFLFSICIGFVFCFAFLGPTPLTDLQLSRPSFLFVVFVSHGSDESFLEEIQWHTDRLKT